LRARQRRRNPQSVSRPVASVPLEIKDMFSDRTVLSETRGADLDEIYFYT
jgi:hypothetical protein